MKKAVVFLLLLSLAACKERIPENEPPVAGEQHTEVPQVNDGFQRFLDQFPEVTLPLKIKACEIKEPTAIDTTISSPFHKGDGYIHGKFVFGENRIAVITLSAADCFLPKLTTYNLSGNIIDSKTLAIGQCADGPCYKCEEVLAIGKDFSIHFADTMQTFECDGDGLPKGEPVSTTVVYRDGKINANGTIELGGEKEKKL